MKKILIAVCLVCLFLVTNVSLAMEIRPDWPPPNWQVLAQGVITNIQNVGPFDTDAFLIKIGNTTLWFNPTAPFASEKTFERAFKMALVFYLAGVEVQVYGIDAYNAVSIAPIH